MTGGGGFDDFERSGASEDTVSGSATTLSLLPSSEHCIEPPGEGDTIHERWDGHCEDTGRAADGAPADRKLHHALASAIPDHWGKTLDAWFIGDQTSDLPDDLEDALEIRKSPAEYGDREFRQYRVRNQLQVSFPSSDGETIDDWSGVTVDTNRDELDPFVLVEGEAGEDNVMRSLVEDAPDADDEEVQELFDSIEGNDALRAEREVFPEPGVALPKSERGNKLVVDGIEGVRVSQIYGGKDTYVLRLHEIYWTLQRKYGPAVGALKFLDLTGMDFAAVPGFVINPPTIYTFVDLAVMADGSRAVRVWDASPYPKHFLYVDGSKRRENGLEEGTGEAAPGVVNGGNWVPRQDVNAERFLPWVTEANAPLTPFDPFSPALYEQLYAAGFFSHPVMTYVEEGAELTDGQLRATLDVPLFPWDQ